MTETKTARALWAARLHLGTGKPATLLSTETTREICEEYVRLVDLLSDPQAVRVNLLRGQIATPPGLVWLTDTDGPVAKLCREEVLKEREACAYLADDMTTCADPDVGAAIRARSP